MREIGEDFSGCGSASRVFYGLRKNVTGSRGSRLTIRIYRACDLYGSNIIYSDNYGASLWSRINFISRRNLHENRKYFCNYGRTLFPNFFFPYFIIFSYLRNVARNGAAKDPWNLELWPLRNSVAYTQEQNVILCVYVHILQFFYVCIVFFTRTSERCSFWPHHRKHVRESG